VISLISKSIGNRIMAAVIITVSLVLGAEILLRVYFGTKDRIQLVQELSKELGAWTSSGIRYPMSVGDSASVQEVLADIRRTVRDVEVFVCDFGAEVVWSTHGEALRTPMSRLLHNEEAMAALELALQTGGTPPHSFAVKLHGRQHLMTIQPILNQEMCYHCHGSSRKVLGGMVVRTDVQETYDAVAAARNRTILISILGISAIITLIYGMVGKFVRDPVQALLHHTQKVSRGDLEHGLKVASPDELGELAQAFNEMTLSLKKARDELEEWGRTLEAKVEARTNELQQMQAQLIRSEKMASLGQLVAGIAHEINNPLTGILVFASLVQKDRRLDPALKEDMDIIVSETQRCGSIVQGLLKFARESIPNKQMASLNRILDSVLSLIVCQACFHNITIVKDYDPQLPEILVDPNQIEQVFINLLLNASHAMRNGGTLTLRTGTTEENTNVFVEVADTGVGIPKENLERIFDPFFTTNEQNGTGLGLSISYGIVKNHGGQIDVESKVGKGTTFLIKFPGKNDQEQGGEGAWGGQAPGPRTEGPDSSQ